MAFSVAFAQPKGSSTKAKAYLDKGDLANAKAEIEAYLNSEKFKKKPKDIGYSLQGQIYKAIAISDKAEDQALLEKPIEKALAAFEKVKEGSAEHKKIWDHQDVDPTTFQYRPSIIDEFRAHFFNQGASLYNDDQDYKGAMSAFETCYMIDPQDTTAALYAFSCALEDDENEAGMMKSFKKLHELNYPKPSPYLSMARLYFTKGMNLKDENKGDEAKAAFEKMLEMTNKGLEVLPSSGDLMKFQIESYIRLERTDDAINLLKKAVQDDPKDSISYFSLGALYDGKKDYAQSEKYYMKALEVSPNYYDVNLNVAAFYIERAKELKRQMEDLVGSTGEYTDEAKAKELGGQRKDKLKQALVYLEKCESLKPGNTEITDNIKTIKDLISRDDY